MRKEANLDNSEKEELNIQPPSEAPPSDLLETDAVKEASCTVADLIEEEEKEEAEEEAEEKDHDADGADVTFDGEAAYVAQEGNGGAPKRAMQQLSSPPSTLPLNALDDGAEAVPVGGDREASRPLAPAEGKLNAASLAVTQERVDVLPKELSDALGKLQREAPPMEFDVIAGQIERELGAMPEVLFPEFDTEPFAAASIGQVHRARSRTFKPRRRRLSPTREAALERLLPQLGLEVIGPTLDPVEVCGRQAPLVIEIGCWAGEAALAMALADPSTDLIACDVHTPGIARLLTEIDRLLTQGPRFQPSTSMRSFRVGGVDGVAVVVAPGLQQIMHAVAPQTCLEVLAGRWPSFGERLETGELDLVIDAQMPDRPGLRKEPLFAADFAAIMRREHPAASAEPLTLDAYLAGSH